MAGEVFVNRVVEDFKNSVVESPLRGRIPDVHSGTFSNRIETFELVDLTGIVVSGRLRRGVVFSGV